MQKASRMPPVVAINRVEPNVVRLQRRGTGREEAVRPEAIEELSALMERASNAARQMKYFSLASKKFSFNELASSALRAGFVQVAANPQLKEASFQWASGHPDLVFSISFRDPAGPSVVAESQADIFGLVLTASSQAATISVDINPTVEDGDLGRSALIFRDMLLSFPGFDDIPAWVKHPEGEIPEGGGLVEMWRDGVSLAFLFGRAWNSISPRVLTVWEQMRRRWYSSR